MKYFVKKTDSFDDAGIGSVSLSPWNYPAAPETVFRVIRSDDAFSVLLRCYEKDPVARIGKKHGPVCNDSCMEFFFSPSPDCSNGYFNFEVNANPTYLFDYGPDSGDGRFHIDWDDGDLSVRSTRGEDEKGAFWQVTFRIPFELIRRFAPDAALSDGDVIRANVYKCGKTDQTEHYSCWSRVGTDGPNFHTPEFFGEFVL